MFKNELIRTAIKVSAKGLLEEAISISLNDPKENLLRICDVYLRQRGWGRTGRFTITASNSNRISSCDNHAIGRRIVRTKSRH
jgi:hypothetical protein